MTRPALDDRGLPAGYPFKPEYEITPRDARDAAAAGRAVIIDVRTAPEHAASRITGATLIPLHELEGRVGEIEAMIDGREDAAIVVHCHHGVRSIKAMLFLRDRGLPNAVSMAGGIEAWSLAVDAAVPRYERGPGGAIRVIPGA
ncbi:MAG: rhodanese-like domain-containing protein [Phycisphaerales bacterium]